MGGNDNFGRLSDERVRILIEVPEVAAPNEIRRLAQEAVDERTRAGFDAHTIKQLEREAPTPDPVITVMRSACYTCVHRREVIGSYHSACGRAPLPSVTADAHGMRNGWFFFPVNFDPVWLLRCDGFEAKAGAR